jgi:phosphate/sulfate permease
VLKTVAFIFISPAMGFLLGALLMIGVAWLLRRTSPLRVGNWFRRLQLVSAGMYSLGHGGNDAQKTIGIIWLLLIAAGLTEVGAARPPAWVIWSCYIAIGLGTLFGGWRIVKTLGQRITKLKPVGAVVPRPAARSPCSRQPRSVCRCRRRTRSPGRTSVSARCARPRRCAGGWRTASSWPGS